MDRLANRMIELKIEEARWQGYCEGKKVMQKWARNCDRVTKEHPDW